MIHAWLHARGENSGHTARFKNKMKELGLSSIYHDLGRAAPLNESTKRYILRCDNARWKCCARKGPPQPALRPLPQTPSRLRNPRNPPGRTRPRRLATPTLGMKASGTV